MSNGSPTKTDYLWDANDYSVETLCFIIVFDGGKVAAVTHWLVPLCLAHALDSGEKSVGFVEPATDGDLITGLFVEA